MRLSKDLGKIEITSDNHEDEEYENDIKGGEALDYEMEPIGSTDNSSRSVDEQNSKGSWQRPKVYYEQDMKKANVDKKTNYNERSEFLFPNNPKNYEKQT